MKPKPTLLDQLTIEVVTSLNDNSDPNVTSKVEEKVFKFLSEDSIINRTRDCKNYFQNYISAQAMVNKHSNVSSH